MTSIQKGRLQQPSNSAGTCAYSEGHFALTFSLYDAHQQKSKIEGGSMH
jgi:hypothetical protein